MPFSTGALILNRHAPGSHAPGSHAPGSQSAMHLAANQATGVNLALHGLRVPRVQELAEQLVHMRTSQLQLCEHGSTASTASMVALQALRAWQHCKHGSAASTANTASVAAL